MMHAVVRELVLDYSIGLPAHVRKNLYILLD